MSDSIRIFVSYSHEDQHLVERLVSILSGQGITPLWSNKLSVGETFDEELKRFIEHAHIFMPILTESALQRGWVQQEIGYALGLRIPIFPVTINHVNPGGMLQKNHAIKLEDDNLKLQQQLNLDHFKSLLKRNDQPALYQKALRPEMRASMMKNYADNVSNLGHYGVVRQKGGLSSFHIPVHDILHPIWNERYIPEKRSEYHKELQRNERLALQEHADKCPVRLLINPNYGIKSRDPISAKARVSTLIEFLEQHEGEVCIALITNPEEMDQLTMVGDWFLAESVSFRDGDGFTNTFFTRNANEINKRVLSFEQELQMALERMNCNEGNSRIFMLNYLKETIKYCGK